MRLYDKFNFYDSSEIKMYNLDQSMRYQISMLDNLDPITKKHSENVGNLAGRICKYLHFNKKFIIHVTICGYLHDIGKLGIPKEILEKPGPLTDEEFEEMKKHTTIGYDICHQDLKLRPYEEGPLYHHEALNGTGYPQGLTKKDIPLAAQIIRVADEYDAIVVKRHYETHVHISETLKELIKDAQPDLSMKTVALDQLSENSKLGKINPLFLKGLFHVVIDDTLYEISCVVDYLDYLKDEIKRLEQVDKFVKKYNKTHSQNKKEYYKQAIDYMLQEGESTENYLTVMQEFREALVLRKERVDDLYREIKIIKKLRRDL
jgi:hypothetical protein